MTDALIDAELLARAAAEGTDRALADYQRARDARATGLFDVADAIASFDWDLTKVQRLHRSLSDEMKKEIVQVNEFTTLRCAAQETSCDALGGLVHARGTAAIARLFAQFAYGVAVQTARLEGG